MISRHPHNDLSVPAFLIGLALGLALGFILWALLL